jgi:cytochrome c oxidase assembly protein subunit 15
VAAWLFGVCAMILVMIVLGGVTRLTGSGLSIMEWAPVTGVLPPRTHAEWEALFALYKSIPQYQLLNRGFGLSGFEHIFWLEWMHRLWGRLIGLAFLVPLAWFWATGRINRRLGWQLAGVFALGGVQGFIGWFMVASGFFPDSTAVAPARLVMHLAMALVLYAAILWTALGLWQPVPNGPRAGVRLLRLPVAICAVSLALTILAGGFVAGTHAGFEYNTFPLMEGRFIPANYDRLHPFLRNLTANIPAVQFDHRVLATLTALSALSAAVAAFARPVGRAARLSVLALTGVVVLQYMLGVATLLGVVPTPLAAAHQAGAVLALTATLVALHGLRPEPTMPAKAVTSRWT